MKVKELVSKCVSICLVEIRARGKYFHSCFTAEELNSAVDETRDRAFDTNKEYEKLFYLIGIAEQDIKDFHIRCEMRGEDNDMLPLVEIYI